MKLIPLHNFVLVRRHEGEQKIASEILISDAIDEKPCQGEVIAASAGNRLRGGILHPLEVKVGDRVLFGKNAGQPVKIDGDAFVVMREDDLIAVLE